ncbi:unnamed protein product [Ixodes pacificus]
MDHGHDGSCSHQTTVPSVHQTLDELDFYKGLLGAAADGDYKKTESLLQKGNDPNQQDSYGYTPLHYSCRQGQARVTELLLRHGAQTDLQTKGGATALHRASYQGHLVCVKHLLDKENGHEEVCRVLVKKSAGLLTVQDAHGRTALDCALSKHPHLSEVLR